MLEVVLQFYEAGSVESIMDSMVQRNNKVIRYKGEDGKAKRSGKVRFLYLSPLVYG